MKKLILPVLFAIILTVVFKQINPAMELVGIAVSGLIGLGIGIGVNNVIFKDKPKDEDKGI